MISADDGTSICNPENLLLDEAEFIVVEPNLSVAQKSLATAFLTYILCILVAWA